MTPILMRIKLVGEYCRTVPQSLTLDCPLIQELLPQMDTGTTYGLCEYICQEINATMVGLKTELKAIQDALKGKITKTSLWDAKKNSAPYLLRFDELHLIYHGIVILQALKEVKHPKAQIPHLKQAINVFKTHEVVIMRLLCENGLTFKIAHEIFFMSGAMLSQPLGCYTMLPGIPDLKDITVIIASGKEEPNPPSSPPGKHAVN